MDVPARFESVVDAVPRELLVELAGPPPGQPILDVTHDSRQVAPGWLFACVVGAQLDGHQFAASAVADGAAGLLVQHRLPLDVPQIVVSDVRRALGPVAAAVHGHPAARLRTIGVTGTNGKTTTTHMLAAILRSTGAATRLIGTLSGVRTTPEAADLQRLLAGFVDEGVSDLVMEVSSHALALHRVAGIRFDAAVFTNLGRDHLDLHESMEAYFRAKASLFTPQLAAVGVTNLDDPYGRLLSDAASIDTVGFQRQDASDIAVSADAIRFTWRGLPVTVPVGGHFNVMNALAALTTAAVLGVDETIAVAGLATCPPVPGRFELVSDPTDDPYSVVVDYAHTPDGLVEVLATARTIAGPHRVIVVFGCGGDRDADKRPLMGAAAAANADLVVLTSDNPRHEDPQAIVDAAASGVEGRYRTSLQIEVDRRRAIGWAIGEARPGDVVVIAGKGHETTQTVGDTAIAFDDRVVARQLLAELRSASTVPRDRIGDRS